MGEAGRGALAAARLLPAGDVERRQALDAAATLLERGGCFAEAADAWAGLVADARDDHERARALRSLGSVSRSAGQWHRAAAAQQEALAVVEALGAGTELAATAQDLAVTYKYLGRFEDAEALYHRALGIAVAAGDEALVAAVCHNLGGLAHARGRPASGIPWARRSVEVRRWLGDRLGLAADQGALAGLLIDAGQLTEAADLLHRARRVFVELLGAVHHEVGVVDGNLAVVALEQGHLPGAEALARSALTLKAAALGPDHPGLAPTLTTLGTVLGRQGDRAGAAALHQRALEVLRPAVEPDHPLLRTISGQLAAHGLHRLVEGPPPDRRGWAPWLEGWSGCSTTWRRWRSWRRRRSTTWARRRAGRA